MQSIYKFRQADVREFIHAQNGGFNPIALKNIVLKTNFRSNETIIHHVNKQFSKIFPKKQDIIRGAIPFSPSTSFHDSKGFAGWLQTDEYSWINQWLSSCDGTIGIIGRSRKHLKLIQSSIDVTHQAVALEPLIYSPIILDLMSLTLTLYSPDSISDIAVQSLPSLGLSWDQMSTQNTHPKWLKLSQQIQ